jgi:MYXO-CTERM domain-containing protein
MGIQVWVLGENRAIPRNYRHTILNEEMIDWFSAGQNYNDVVIKAVDEADGHHSFITEYAGTTDVMKGVLDPEGRFGTQEEFLQISDPGQYVANLRARGFVWTSPLINTLKEYIPFPAALRDTGVDEESYYNQLDYYLTSNRQQNPSVYENAGLENFTPTEITTKLWERIVTPTLSAAVLFKRFPKMTRLYTTLSPDEMTKDPVFSFNADLPDVSNIHEATFTYICSFFQDGPSNTPAILRLPDNREFYVKNQAEWTNRDTTGVPYSTQIQLLREEGPPEVEVDNSNRISGGDKDSGCSCSTGQERSPLGMSLIALLALGLFVAVPRKR